MTTSSSVLTASSTRWTPARVWDYVNARPWQTGFNYLPASCVNFIEMWQDDGFDEAAIARELDWARELGFTSARVYLQFANWRDEREVMLRHFDKWLEISSARGFSSLVVLFDDCGHNALVPACGPQGEPVPGCHNSRQMPSPGHPLVRDQSVWPDLKRYAQDVIGRYRDDARIYGWDIYNEPGQCGIKGDSLGLLVETFNWAREANPSQPLTSGIFTATQGIDDQVSDDEAWIPPLNEFLLENSDIISFHCYGNAQDLELQIASLKLLGRPLLCTEWLARHVGSHVETCLPVFARERVGCYTWGLVNGRSQTNFPWFTPSEEQRELWFHDVLHPSGAAYTESEGVAWRAGLAAQPLAAQERGRN